MAEVADDAGVNRSWGDLGVTPRFLENQTLSIKTRGAQSHLPP
jgi:hypothetical protein